MVVFTSPGNERVEPRRDAIAKTYKIDIECRVWGECLLFTTRRAEVTMLTLQCSGYPGSWSSTGQWSWCWHCLYNLDTIGTWNRFRNIQRHEYTRVMKLKLYTMKYRYYLLYSRKHQNIDQDNSQFRFKRLHKQ